MVATAKILAAAFAVAVHAVNLVEGCTLFAIGRKATADGSVMIAHTDDAGPGTCDNRLLHVPAKDHKEGSKRPVYFTAVDRYPRMVSKERAPAYAPVGDQEESDILGYIPQVPHTYAYYDADYALINEHQLIIGETTTNAKTAGWPTNVKGGKCLFGIEELTKVALERCDSARCAVKTMGKLAYEHGFWGADAGTPQNPIFAASSETVAIGDKYGEAWVFHVMTGLNNESAIWAAQRVPDDHIAPLANAFSIREMNLDDEDNFLASPNVHSAAVEMGWWNPETDGPFDFFRSYAFGNGSEPLMPLYVGRRIWRIYGLVAPSMELDPKWGSVPERPSYPFSAKPDEPITIEKTWEIMRDYYQGTPYDTSKGMGAGFFGNPARFSGRPPAGIKGGWERTIAMARTSFSFVAQARPDMPDHIGGRVWWGYDAQWGTVYTPFYGAADDLPEAYYSHKCAQSAFSLDCAWWAFNFVNNWRYLNFEAMTPDVEAEQKRLEETARQQTEELERGLLKIPKKEALKALNKYQSKHAQHVVDSWWTLAAKLIAKYQGGHVTNGEGTDVLRTNKTGRWEYGYPALVLQQSEFNGWPKDTYYYPGHEPKEAVQTLIRSKEAATSLVQLSQEAPQGSFSFLSFCGGIVVGGALAAFMIIASQRRRFSYSQLN